MPRLPVFLIFGCLAAPLPSAIAAAQYVLHAGTENVCTAARNFLNDSPRGQPKERFETLLVAKPAATSELPERLSGGALLDFDFDNDGFPDEVFEYVNAGSYISGTLLYVRRGTTGPATPKRLQVDEIAIFPCQFDPRVPNSKSCPPLSQDADEAGISISMPKLRRPIFFRGRYTLMEPVRYSGRTYIVLRGNSFGVHGLAAVIEPTGGLNYRSVCLLKRKA